MPSDDKKSLPALITKGIGKDISRRDFGKGLTGIATEIVTGPLLDSGLSAVGNISKGSSILEKIPMTKELIKRYYKIESLKEKFLNKLAREKKFEIGNIDNWTYQQLGPVTVETLYEEIKRLTEDKIRLTRYLKTTDPGTISINYIARYDEQGKPFIAKDKIKKDLNDATRRLKNILNILDDNENKVQKKAILELLKLDNERNEIRTIASNKKLPFNFAIEQVQKAEEDFMYDAASEFGQIPESDQSDAEFLNEAREEYFIDDAFENIKKFEDLENKYNTIDSIEEKERIKQDILNGTFMNLEKYNFKSMQFSQGYIQQIIRDPNLPADFKEHAAEQGAEQYITNEKNRIKSLLESNTYTVYDSGGSDVYSDTYREKEIEPIYSKDILNAVKEEILSAGKTIGVNIAKDYVKDKIVTRGGFEGQELKPGPWTQKLADYLKSLKTPSGPTIESDKTRASKAKVVEEVKPNRNLAEDLKRVGRVIKASPYVAGVLTGITPTKIDPEDTAELPLDPRAIEIERALQRGRVSRDPYKNYNKQRAI